KILEFCKEPHGVSEIAEMLGIKDKKWVRRQYVAPMVGKTLEMTLPEKPHSRHQKYRTIQPKQ
ncbi:MAG: hypothetical protein Q4C88_03760, partial [Akkermansia sp.]|nr:hypothetical protein [Akkermansia sp.]